MKRLYLTIFILLIIAMASGGCATSRKNDRRLNSLMLLDNTKLGRNKAYYSKHNKKTKRIAYRKYRKNKRH